jgi:hypothetical protein
MIILNEANGPEVKEIRSRRYDRMNGSSEFIGQALDLTGVARTTVPYPETDPNHPGRSKWATMISPSFFLSANHFKPDQNTTLRFYFSNDPTDFVEREVDSIVSGGANNLGDDVWIGKLKQPVPNGIAIYPVMVVQELQDYVGTELWVMGKSGNIADLPLHGVLPDSVMRDEAIRLRIGRNRINGNVGDSLYKFTFDVSFADVANENGGYLTGGHGDGKVDQFDILEFTPTSTFPLPSYIDGDVARMFQPATGPPECQEGSDGVVNGWDGCFIAERFDSLADTDSFGWDEAANEDGDSGGPSFTEFGGKLVLTGMHNSVVRGNQRETRDSCPGLKYTSILAFIKQHSGGTEHPVSASYSDEFILGEQSWSLPPGLQKQKLLPGDLNGDFLLNNDDINLMAAEVRAYLAEPNRPYNWALDLDENNAINTDDLELLLVAAFQTAWSDLNLDGVVTVLGDAFTLVANLDRTDALREDGDINGDSVVNVLVDAFQLVGELEKRRLLRINPDYNDDGVLDALDIDILNSEVVAGGTTDDFDFSSAENFGEPDGVVNIHDLNFYMEHILGTQLGDFNLDGVLDDNDVALVFDALVQLTQTGSPIVGGYAAGDLNADGEITPEDGAILQDLVDAQQ